MKLSCQRTNGKKQWMEFKLNSVSKLTAMRSKSCSTPDPPQLKKKDNNNRLNKKMTCHRLFKCWSSPKTPRPARSGWSLISTSVKAVPNWPTSISLRITKKSRKTEYQAKTSNISAPRCLVCQTSSSTASAHSSNKIWPSTKSCSDKSTSSASLSNINFISNGSRILNQLYDSCRLNYLHKNALFKAYKLILSSRQQFWRRRGHWPVYSRV